MLFNKFDIAFFPKVFVDCGEDRVMIRFKDRKDAGIRLAAKLQKYKNNSDAIVIGLPRGGVVTAFEVARVLGLSLDIIVTRKIAYPSQPELALGALTQEGVPILDKNLMNMMGVTKQDLEIVIEVEKKESQRRIEHYRGNRSPLNLKEKIAIIVDDGIATGATMRAAIVSAVALKAKKIVIAIPVSPVESLEKIKKEVGVDEVVCLETPEPFWGVGGFYDSFIQTDDTEVVELINKIST